MSVQGSWSFSGIGTGWSVETPEPLPDELRRMVLERVERFDVTWSRFRPDSLVSRIATAADGGVFDIPAEDDPLLGLYDRLVAVTGGALDPLVGRQLELLGYDAGYSLIPAPPELREREARDRPAWESDVIRDGATLVTRRPLVIDVGAAGKGFLVDSVAELLTRAGVGEFVIDASGDLRHRGLRGQRIGLEHPADPRSVIGVVELRNGALCASATNRRAWGRGCTMYWTRALVARCAACWPPGCSPPTPPPPTGWRRRCSPPTPGACRRPLPSPMFGCMSTGAPRPRPGSPVRCSSSVAEYSAD